MNKYIFYLLQFSLIFQTKQKTILSFYSSFSRVLEETVRSLAPQCTVTFLPSEEGSGKGAALITAVARRKHP